MAIKNEYQWNKTLKFSWGHIIAFVALIILSYIACMGIFYSNGGNVVDASIKVLLIDVVILSVFLGAQITKASDKKFKRSIIIERILVVLCPFALCFGMIPCNHFWNVLSEKDEIETNFSETIKQSNELFNDYEEYAKGRVTVYEEYLNGFGTKYDEVTKRNYLEILQVQLLIKTEDLRKNAQLWVKNADHEVSVWNAFLVGNVDVISNAVGQWNYQLFEVSDHILSNEPQDVVPFSSCHKSYESIKTSLEKLKEIYTTPKRKLNINTIWFFVILFLMLIFPYILQGRCTRAKGFYHLVPDLLRIRKTSSEQSSVTYERKSSSEKIQSGEQDDDIYSGTF